ncbi:TPA: ribonuclease P protein component 1 [Candidatus Bathyarchaeota archaeon]|nr:ribonuclease P protein component 1 [Candidatus Bathyarchaeota archaeon]HIJ09004.1 ribonuclease P protein component 1 [Candidatus Bathyarchaeota archaeon]
MKVTPDIIRSEFIGSEAEVSESPHEGYIGLSGRIIDETKNTLTILQGDKAKHVVKENAVFRFKYSDGTIVQIDGKLLTGRPEDRLKKTIKRLW